MGSLSQTSPVMSVLVVYAAGPDQTWQRRVALVSEPSVAQAIVQSGFCSDFPDVDWQAGRVGIFGKRVTPETIVADGDRIEIYRPLVFDPKESRRRRARHRQRQQLKGKKKS